MKKIIRKTKVNLISRVMIWNKPGSHTIDSTPSSLFQQSGHTEPTIAVRHRVKLSDVHKNRNHLAFCPTSDEIWPVLG